MSEKKQKAVILLSGGLDSATTLAIAADKGFICHTITFLYGQKHLLETEAAKKIAKSLNAADSRFIRLNPAAFPPSALTSKDIPVPKNNPHLQDTNKIPPTYVPARNTIFLSYALAWAEAIDAFDIFIGVNALDYSGYPDCRPEFIKAFQTLANLATAAAVKNKRNYKINTPVIDMTKAQIIGEGTRLGIDYSLTLSCYNPDPDARSCGKCDSCKLRLNGFEQANLKDPIEYVK